MAGSFIPLQITNWGNVLLLMAVCAIFVFIMLSFIYWKTRGFTR